MDSAGSSAQYSTSTSGECHDQSEAHTSQGTGFPRTPTTSPTHLLSEADFDKTTLRDVVVDNDALNAMCVTRASHQIRRLLRHFRNSESAREIITYANQKCRERPCTQIFPLPPLYETFPNVSRNGLLATRNILAGEFVIAPVPALLKTPEECGRDEMGIIHRDIILYNGLQSDFVHCKVFEDVPTQRKRKRDSDAFLLRRKVRVIEARNEVSSIAYQSQEYYYSDEDIKEVASYDKYDICLDLKNSTNELRAIRRNCTPNCLIRYVFLHQRMQVFVCAQENINAGEEITLPHDYDSNLSCKVIQCTHPFEPDRLCLHEKERRITITNYLKRLAEEATRNTDDSQNNVPI